ncbi:dTMP kinase [Neolewinella xylanilytica]|uniref:Thymidylate kinase n=1 Tax=Neolewinella xylanilytica TaxID=1514080 RepID=A0A2S6I601_9BACT|nr:dTMP kinase [Neolewinella xylanilytica]PPK86588.1 dTMP kinase [Neolewinella xylanilytica]
MQRPLFIVIEGLDGSGKSTQIDLLRDYFHSRGEACHVTAEPTGFPTGKLIRSVLRKEIEVDPRTLAAMFAADRIEHLFHPEAGLLAKLAAGYHVVASRYYFSSLAYQSEFVDPGFVASLNRLAKATLPADLTVFLDLDPQVSMQRIQARPGEDELFETLDKLRHVRESFLNAFTVFGEDENIQTVDANQPLHVVAETIQDLIDKL